MEKDEFLCVFVFVGLIQIEQQQDSRKGVWIIALPKVLAKVSFAIYPLFNLSSLECCGCI